MAEQKEILESIRDIISGKPGDDDILDLTHMVNADGSITEIERKTVSALPQKETKENKQTPIKPETAMAPTEPQSDDILSEIDSLLSGGDKKPEADKKVELEFSAKDMEEAAATGPIGTAVIMPRDEGTPTTITKEKMEKGSMDQILSDASAAEAKSSISDLMGKLKKEGRETPAHEPSAPFRSGATVEDLVIEMLKPMMKDWLDKNLPKLVNEIVQKEIQKLVPRD